MSKALTYLEVDVPPFVRQNEVTGVFIQDFHDNSVHGWTGANGTVTAGFNGMLLTQTGADPIFRSASGLTIDGSLNRYVRIDIERTVIRSSGAWDGTLLYTTAAHGESGSFKMAIPDVANVAGTRQVFILDMAALTAGETDWITSTITQLRLDLDSAGSGTFLLHSIVMGDLDTVRAAVFDGTNDYLTRGAGLYQAADSKLMTFSAWVYIVAGNSGRLISSSNSVAGGGSLTRVVLSTDNRFSIVGVNAADATILDVQSSLLFSNRWNHLLASVDLSDPTKRHVYVNDVLDLALINTYTNDTIDFTKADWAIGALPDGSSKFNGYISDLWFAPGVYLDLSIEGNRRKFYSAQKGPTDLGRRGEIPTGTAPLVYMGGPFTAWQINKGAGGSFIENGALTGVLDPVETWRFAQPVDYLPPEIDAIPSMKSLSFNPATVSLGEDLGIRASVSATFLDHKHMFNAESFDQGSFWGKWRGRYGTKLRNAPVRVIRGLAGQALTSMTTYYYAMDTTEGPTPDGAYNMVAKDLLKLTDDARSQAPRVSNGSLAGSISNSATSATLSPVGIGNLEYPASGYVCFGGKEAVSFTRAGDVLTIVRGQLNTTPIAHNAGDRVQLVLRYSGNDVADIIKDLLVTYVSGITSDMIPIAEWQAETAAYLGVIYAANITEPTSVKKLIIELIEQAALALFWDDKARLIRLKVLREIATTTDTFDEERIITGSLKVSEQPDKRISQIWTFYGQRDPTDQADNEDNYRAALASVDLAKESQYGNVPAITKVPARWVATLTAAQRLNGIKLSRFRDPPRKFQFSLFRDQAVGLGLGYQLKWWANQNVQGIVQPAKIQITKVRIEADLVFVEAEEMLASGVIIVTNTIFLLTTGSVLSLVVPAAWNSANNSIDVIGGGGGGANENGNNGGHGGGGGAYSGITNLTLTPGASVSYRVGIGGTATVDGGDTWFNGASFAAASVAAKGGTAGVGRTSAGNGGQASAGIGTVKFSGGEGGDGAPQGETRAGGGGGGGAGGPNGNGARALDMGSTGDDGGSGGGAGNGGFDGHYPSGLTGGDGGNNRFNFGGGTTSVPAGQDSGGGRGGDNGDDGNPGGQGEQLWTQSIAPIIPAGPGGGGGGGGNNGRGGDGGLYGGGAGGSGGDTGGGGTAGQGIIVLTWR